jgi:hypothetical protein
MDPKRLLVYLPPELLERANREVASPDSAATHLNDLVVEALGQYLDELDAATGAQATMPELPSSTSLRTEAIESITPEIRLHQRGPADPWAKIDPQLASVLSGAGSVYRFLASALDSEFGSTKKLSPSSPEAIRFLELRDEVIQASRIEAVRCQALEPDPDIANPDGQQPIFGLHNRDYTSLWSLQHLASATREGPVNWSEFAPGLSILAQQFGSMAVTLDEVRVIGGEHRSPGLRYVSGFPKPSPEAQMSGSSTTGQWLSSTRGAKRARLSSFVRNNVASVQRSRDPAFAYEARGPLASWNAITFRPDGSDFLVSPSEAGISLLEGVAGVSLDLPHSPQQADTFFRHLARYSPGDSQGFRAVLTPIASNPTREELIEETRDFFVESSKRGSGRGLGPQNPDRYTWTMAQGYLARAREWGLVDPSMTRSERSKSRVYALTEIGEEILKVLGNA